MIWKEIFKTGTHTDSAGNQNNWTIEVLDRIVEIYKNQPKDSFHEAPVVIGHPLNNSPAYAWVKSLKRENNILFAQFSEMHDGFKKLIEEGRYKKVSAAFYPNLLLRHVGYLGAYPPAVKGLPDTQFKDDSEFITLDFLFSMSDTKNGIELTLDKNNFTEKKEKEKGSPTPPQKEIEKKDYIYNHAEKNFEKNNSINSKTNPKGNSMDKVTQLHTKLLTWLGKTFSEELANQTAAQIETLKKEIGLNTTQEPDKKEDLKNKNDFAETPEYKALQLQLKALEQKNRDLEFNDYFKSQHERLTPAQLEITKLAFNLVSDSDQTYQFSEGEKKVTLKGEEVLKKLIESFPKQIEFGEFASKSNYGGPSDDGLSEQNKSIDNFNKERGL